MDIVNPTNRTVIVQVTLADDEDARRAIAATRAFTTYGRTTKEKRVEILLRLHQVVSARVDELTAVMVEEYGDAAWFCRLIIEAGASVFQSAEKALQELPVTKGWGKTTVTLEPVGVASLIQAGSKPNNTPVTSESRNANPSTATKG